MPHHHHAGAGNFNRAFAIGVALNVAFVAAELIFGLMADSMALVADAGHNLSDVLSLLLAWGASVLAQALPTRRRTYGFRRSTILVSLLNAVLLLIGIGAIAWESFRRLGRPVPVQETMVMWVAGFGVIINGITALMFMSGRKSDLNVKGAFLHMAADAGISAGVVVAAVVISVTGWYWLDPAVSLAIVVVVAVGTWGLFRDSVNLAMDAVPEGIDPAEVEAFLAGGEGVTGVHDLHIWAMSTTEVALTAHLTRPGRSLDDSFLADLSHQLHDRFGIEHATLQVEQGDGSGPCKLSVPGGV